LTLIKGAIYSGNGQRSDLLNPRQGLLSDLKNRSLFAAARLSIAENRSADACRNHFVLFWTMGLWGW
jgi:hypothetical protein